MILFIHGFGSCGWGEKSLQLRRHFGVDQVLAPDLPFHPRDAIRQLEGLCRRYPIRALVGSSLGGFYATWLNRERSLPSVLINPVVRPQELPADFVGTHRRWCDDFAFEVSDSYMAALGKLQRDRLGQSETYLVMLQQGDEVLDYHDAASFYSDKTLLQIRGGNHRFEGFDGYLPVIDDWLKQHGARPHAKETETAT